MAAAAAAAAAAGGAGGSGAGGSSSGSGSGSVTGGLVPSLPPPRPKSPPDLYGKRRILAKVQMLERERSFLEEELKYTESLQPASRCCKEIVDFVAANADPLTPINQKVRKPCRLWKWLCAFSCFKLPRFRHCPRCSIRVKATGCCKLGLRDCCACISCSLPKCRCNFKPCSCCCSEISCCCKCSCECKLPSCWNCKCCKCRWCYPKWSKICCCFTCLKNCCCEPLCCTC